MQTVSLKSGDQMPVLGLGTWQLTGQECINAIPVAVEIGYRHIDTADAYKNHKDVAQGLKKAGIAREKLFITSKLFLRDMEPENVLKTGPRMLSELGIDYLDLLLIHWPLKEVPFEETLGAMAELQKKDLIKNIGVSNFTIKHLKEVEANSNVEITNNQIECHPYIYQEELINYCQERDIIITAYSPLARGDIFEDADIKKMSDKYDYSPACLVLKWLVDKGLVVIPKASSREHIKDNFKILEIELPAEVREMLDKKHENRRLVEPGFADF